MNRFSLAYGSMHSPRKCLVLAGVLLIVLTQQAQARGDEDDLKRWFSQEAPLKWEEYLRRIRELQGKVAFHGKMSAKNILIDQTYEYKRNKNGKRIQIIHEESEQGKKQYKESVYGVNPKYSFEIRRKSPDSPWVVGNLVNLREEDVPEKYNRFLEMFPKEESLLVSLDGEPLTEAVSQPTFHVDHCRLVRHGEEELVEVVFSYPHEASQGLPRKSAVSGTLTLDPKKFWVVRSKKLNTRVNAKDGGMSGVVNMQVEELDETLSSLPIPKAGNRTEEWFYDTQLVSKGFPAKVKNETSWRFDLIDPGPLPGDEEFTLSAFGLPEPPDAFDDSPIRWYLWLGIAGIISIALAAYIQIQRRRRVIGESI